MACGAVRSTSTLLYQRTRVRALSRFHGFILTNVAQCSAATNHLITNAVFNISSDIIILSIPLPLLFKVRLPKKNKLILIGIFLIGLFTVSTFLLRRATLTDLGCCGCTEQVLLILEPVWNRLGSVVPPRVVHRPFMRKPASYIPTYPTDLQVAQLELLLRRVRLDTSIKYPRNKHLWYRKKS